MKKITLIILTTLIFSCKSMDNSSTNVPITKTSGSITTKPEKQDSMLIHEKLSESVINSVDIEYRDYAVLIINLINNKNWDEISNLTDKDFYTSYVVESSGSLIDYCMFMLHTGDKGVSTNYSLNEINNAYYTSYAEIDDGIILEGIYLYPTEESEYFKIVIKHSDGLIITRE